MDTEDETTKLKFLLFTILAFLVSGFFAYMELKYATGGKTAEATVDRIGETRGRRGRTTTVAYYHYRDEAGNLRNGSAPLDRDFSPSAGDTIAVEYLDDTSRPAGQRNTVALVVFFGCLLALAVGGFLFWRHVREATRPAKPYKVPKRF